MCISTVHINIRIYCCSMFCKITKHGPRQHSECTVFTNQTGTLTRIELCSVPLPWLCAAMLHYNTIQYPMRRQDSMYCSTLCWWFDNKKINWRFSLKILEDFSPISEGNKKIRQHFCPCHKFLQATYCTTDPPHTRHNVSGQCTRNITAELLLLFHRQQGTTPGACVIKLIAAVIYG